ncbi:hypothetical protein BDQ17DRAFT_835844 [Cyathus striatus]|nr:hypothetical protein BDQ17DRAFT_835844 [Cyathus striatus]
MLESERRRLKRIQDKNINTTCFACREKGHAAKDCPKNAPVEGDEKGKSKELLGICYRCGSRKHTLSRCKKLTDPDNPLPYASCFVCDGKGHLASSCPQNKDKGLYPNGGCCKLCGDNTHMAKDCGIRKQDMVNTATFLGTGLGLVRMKTTSTRSNDVTRRLRKTRSGRIKRRGCWVLLSALIQELLKR